MSGFWERDPQPSHEQEMLSLARMTPLDLVLKKIAVEQEMYAAETEYQLSLDALAHLQRKIEALEALDAPFEGNRRVGSETGKGGLSNPIE